MKRETGFSLRPDPDTAWIYDYRHPHYDSEEAEDLRERRLAAMRQCPQWMIDMAVENDDD